MDRHQGHGDRRRAWRGRNAAGFGACGDGWRPQRLCQLYCLGPHAQRGSGREQSRHAGAGQRAPGQARLLARRALHHDHRRPLHRQRGGGLGRRGWLGVRRRIHGDQRQRDAANRYPGPSRPLGGQVRPRHGRSGACRKRRRFSAARPRQVEAVRPRRLCRDRAELRAGFDHRRGQPPHGTRADIVRSPDRRQPLAAAPIPESARLRTTSGSDWEAAGALLVAAKTA